ncbi:MAG: NAD-dependent epimerase/dehydratase family protein, partial [Xanthomonadales bacterium]|nr:NAD-dependent epimerase/dehydratase family protein [Xanthomonadales bacterium]NIN32294.1 NAD-dependent epimerase/dehydratase family protein [Hydrogenophaga sp.]NIN60534.1 NAD-dependent epimerase/dehydratase family protein [Xanthomonadales bacterium]NIN75886.1 NAD-dependent epimerase/dehydratase family protein [Xanthomonadales bacterium]NIO13024.1 NAD-dependent epimerase/dehydratase family protein [Xanthomonadales bacterium]
EACRISRTPHLVFASSSSVYGANAKLPFSEHDGVDHPISLYSATKRANELMAHSYAHLYGLPATGLRLFTVYGPWGRPDMAYYAFTRNILTGEPIEVFNHGRHRRDFTYIDDVVGRVVSVMDEVPQPNEDWNPQEPDPATSNAPFRLYNIGNGQPVYVDDLIAAIETAAGKKATRLNLEMQPEDMLETWADCSDLDALYEDIPATDIADGVTRFVRWFK